MPEIVLDITEILRNPLRTGIQRVVRELIRWWPASPRLGLARFEQGRGLRAVSDRVRPLLLETDAAARAATVEVLKGMIAGADAGGGRPLRSAAPILVPEVCYSPERWAWYEALRRRDPDRFAMIVFDFIPWLYGDVYSAGPSANIASYFELVTRAKRLCFISAATRDDAASRIGRPAGDPGPVFTLGADGLGIEPRPFDDARQTYVMVGSVCRNKGHDLVFAAFERLWREGFAGELIFAGRDADGDLKEVLAAAASCPRFRHLANPTDDVLRATLLQARATIAVSKVEGYGLAPVESLYAGIPTIVSANVPSVRGLPPLGQIRLDRPDVDGIAAAVRAVADSATARRLWSEAAQLTLPTWRAFAAAVAAWMAPPVPATGWRRLFRQRRLAAG